MARAKRFVETMAYLKKHNDPSEFHIVKEMVNKEKYGDHQWRFFFSSGPGISSPGLSHPICNPVESGQRKWVYSGDMVYI